MLYWIKALFYDETNSVQYTNQITEDFNFINLTTYNFIFQAISTEISNQINSNELTTEVN